MTVTNTNKQLKDVPTIYVLSKNKKNIKTFSTENLYSFKNVCILHGHVFVMLGLMIHFTVIS